MAPICALRGLLYYDLQGSHSLVDHELIREADILHLQNLHGGYFNPFSLIALTRMKPTVWTLRDMQAITGHCAHSFACDRWKHGCGECADLSIYPRILVDSTKRLWRDKHFIYSNSLLHVVCPSSWLFEKLPESILSSHPATVIYNGIDTQKFRPYPRTDVRRELGIDTDAFVFGVVADGGLANPFKGGAYLRQAVERLRSASHSKFVFISVGNRHVSAPSLHRDGITYFPPVRNDELLAKIYSSLDCFLYSSVAETAGLVVMEAMSCGVPVIAFDTGGVPEIARHNQEGIIVPYRDVDALVRAALDLHTSPELQKRFAASARERAVSIFDITRVAAEYCQLYFKVIENHSRRVSSLEKLDLTQMPLIARTDSPFGRSVASLIHDHPVALNWSMKPSLDTTRIDALALCRQELGRIRPASLGMRSTVDKREQLTGVAEVPFFKKSLINSSVVA